MCLANTTTTTTLNQEKNSQDDTDLNMDLSFKKIMLPNDLARGMNLVVLLTRTKHIESVDSWLGVRQALEHLLKQQSKDVQIPGGELNM